MSAAAVMPTPTLATVHAMRRARRRRRLGDLEWFDIAYRVYLAALGGGLLVAWLSDLVTDEAVEPAALADVVERGPAVIGLAAAAALALGLRSGSDGGPVSIEAADVRYLLAAPVPRGVVLRRPVAQRMRALAFSGAVVGAMAGQLASRRLPGSAPAWAASVGAAGAVVGVAFVAVATVTHALHTSRSMATGLAVLVVGWQVIAATDVMAFGPGDGVGSLALWGMRSEPLDLVSVAVVVGIAAAALVLCARLTVEALATRADLVSQLRFAVTVQDLRTVVLLRRQLRGERPRPRPLLRVPRWGGDAGPDSSSTAAVVRRGGQGVARYPTARLARMAALAVGAGAAAAATVAGTTPAVLAMALALYVLGLDAIEPLSQEIDRPDRTDALPVERGALFGRHLIVAAITLVPFALIAAATVAVWRPSATPAGLAIAVPTVLLGATGSVVSAVRDAPNPLSTTVGSNAMPPEFAGFASSIQLLLPLVVSATSAIGVLLMKSQPSAATALRVVVLSALILSALVFWVRRRDAWRAAWQRLLEGSRQ